jgi:hypothetical protein
MWYHVALVSTDILEESITHIISEVGAMVAVTSSCHIPEDGILQSQPWKPQILHSITQLGYSRYVMSPVRYELGFYIPEDNILHSHCCENLTFYNCDVCKGATDLRRLKSQSQERECCFCLLPIKVSTGSHPASYLMHNREQESRKLRVSCICTGATEISPMDQLPPHNQLWCLVTWTYHLKGHFFLIGINSPICERCLKRLISHTYAMQLQGYSLRFCHVGHYFTEPGDTSHPP